MKKTLLILYLLIVCITISFIIGCATSESTTQSITASDKPEWVDKGPAAFPGDAGKYFYAVGIAGKSRNPSAARRIADNRARVEIAKTVKTYTASFMKDYMREYPDYFDKSLSGSEEYIEAISKSVSEATLRGCEIIDHWTAPDGTVYALARMPKEATDKELIASAREKAGNKLKVKADLLEKKLNEELEKLHKREQEQAKESLGK